MPTKRKYLLLHYTAAGCLHRPSLFTTNVSSAIWNPGAQDSALPCNITALLPICSEEWKPAGVGRWPARFVVVAPAIVYLWLIGWQLVVALLRDAGLSSVSMSCNNLNFIIHLIEVTECLCCGVFNIVGVIIL